MVNYRRVCLAALGLLVAATAAPLADCDKDKSVHYDQRQNGTENYRLNIDGVVIAVAPAETFLEAASEFDISDLIDLDYFGEGNKPEPQKPHDKPKPEADVQKPEEKPQEDKPKPEVSETAVKPVEAPPSEVKASRPYSKGQKKDASMKKQSRLRSYMYNIIGSLLRNRHHQASNK